MTGSRTSNRTEKGNGSRSFFLFPSSVFLLLILLLSVVLRVAAALYLGNDVVSMPGTADQVSYHTLALRLLDGHGFSFAEAWWPLTAANAPTAHWSYLYTGYLALVYTLFGPHPIIARLIQAVAVGLLQPLMAYWLAQHARDELVPSHAEHQRWAQYLPLLAAAITAVYIYFIYYAASLMTEPFYFVTIMAALLLAIRLPQELAKGAGVKTAVGLGVTLGLTILLRQLFLLIVPLIFLWLLVAARGARRAMVQKLIFSAIIIIILILPFTLYNDARFDRFVLLNTNAGYAFFWANHPVYGAQFLEASEMSGEYADLVPNHLRHLDEASLDQALLKEGLRYVWNDPGRYARLSLSRIPIYFKFWPEATSGALSNLSRLASFALFLPFMLAGLLRASLALWRQVKEAPLRALASPLTLLVAFLATYTTIHILSWVQVRYRLPVDAILVIFAAVAAAELLATIRARALRPNSTLAPTSSSSPKL